VLGWLKPKQSARKLAPIEPRVSVDSLAYVSNIDGVWVPNSESLNKLIYEQNAPSPEELTAICRGWLNRLSQESFGGRLSSGESGRFILLADVSPTHGKNILAFAEKTLSRYINDFGDIAEFGPASKMPIIALSQPDDYYKLISAFFDEGTYGLSSGLFVRRGIGFFIFPNEEMWALEAVIAHELLHAVMTHLPIPAWLNEGLAVNAEFRYGNRVLDPRRRDDLMPHHHAYWDEAKLQQFLNGELFSSATEGQELSYDLARQLVLGLSNDWPRMKEFIVSANFDDAGESAAMRVFGLSLAVPLEVATSVKGVKPLVAGEQNLVAQNEQL
jgi:hypothetical protein